VVIIKQVLVKISLISPWDIQMIKENIPQSSFAKGFVLHKEFHKLRQFLINKSGYKGLLLQRYQGGGYSKLFISYEEEFRYKILPRISISLYHNIEYQ